MLEGWQLSTNFHLFNQGQRVLVVLHQLLAVNLEKPAAHLSALLTQSRLHRAPPEELLSPEEPLLLLNLPQNIISAIPFAPPPLEVRGAKRDH